MNFACRFSSVLRSFGLAVRQSATRRQESMFDDTRQKTCPSCMSLSLPAAGSMRIPALEHSCRRSDADTAGHGHWVSMWRLQHRFRFRHIARRRRRWYFFTAGNQRCGGQCAHYSEESIDQGFHCNSPFTRPRWSAPADGGNRRGVRNGRVAKH